MARAKSPSKTAASANGDAGSNGTATVSKKKIPSSALQMSSAESNAAKASISEEKIRQRAYELYMQRGGQHGRHADDWFRAEAELRSRS